MGLIGDLLSLPVKIINAPIRAAEDLLGLEEDERFASKPLEKLADELENVDE